MISQQSESKTQQVEFSQKMKKQKYWRYMYDVEDYKIYLGCC